MTVFSESQLFNTDTMACLLGVRINWVPLHLLNYHEGEADCSVSIVSCVILLIYH